MDTQLAGRTLTTPLGRPETSVSPQAIGLALATLEGLQGRRGLHQLRPWLSHAAFLQLVLHVEAGTFAHSSLGRMRAQMPTPAAVEASARISLKGRWLACAVRLDHVERWTCSDIAVLGLTAA